MALHSKGNFIINNDLEVSPKSLLCRYDSLASSNSGRTLDGVMHIYWVFNKIRKLEIQLAPASADYLALIFSRVQGQEYNITYWDILENQEKTIHVYTSNSEVDCYSGVVRNGLYQGAKFHAIEIAGENNAYYIVSPVITSVGDLEINNNSLTTSFTRVGDNLVVEESAPGVTYSIVGEDLMRYEE